MTLIILRKRSVGRHLSRDLAVVGTARRLIRDTLAEWDLAERTDHATLIGSELVTNALKHGAGSISIRLSLYGSDLQVEVHDGGAGRPVRRPAGSDDEGGRGLEVIDGLLRSCNGERGCAEDNDGPGKTVYAVMRTGSYEAGSR